MTRYNKLWTALILAAAFALLRYLGMAPDGLEPMVTEAIQTAVIGIGVWAVPNTD